MKYSLKFISIQENVVWEMSAICLGLNVLKLKVSILWLKVGQNGLTCNIWRPSYPELTRSLSWFLMPWLLESPGHQHPWYWLCRIGKSLFYLKKDFNCVHSLWSMQRIDINCKYCKNSNIRRTKLPKLKCFSAHLAVVFAQSNEARC